MMHVMIFCLNINTLCDGKPSGQVINLGARQEIYFYAYVCHEQKRNMYWFCYTPPIPTVFVDCFFHLAAACSELRSNHSISLIKDNTPSPPVPEIGWYGTEENLSIECILMLY